MVTETIQCLVLQDDWLGRCDSDATACGLLLVGTGVTFSTIACRLVVQFGVAASRERPEELVDVSREGPHRVYKDQNHPVYRPAVTDLPRKDWHVGSASAAGMSLHSIRLHAHAAHATVAPIMLYF